jgi:hypothetical protein
MRSVRSSESTGAQAIPMLGSTCSERPATEIGALIAAAILPAQASTSKAASRPGISSANSSPPRRTSTSPVVMVVRRRAPTVHSTSSPIAWPSESLTSLNRSRSMSSRYMNSPGPSPVSPASIVS